MRWDGRSSRPAVAGATELDSGPTSHAVTFPAPFDGAPSVDIPILPEGVTATVTEVTETGFTLTVTGQPADDQPTVIEWIAADTDTDTPAQEEST